MIKRRKVRKIISEDVLRPWNYVQGWRDRTIDHWASGLTLFCKIEKTEVLPHNLSKYRRDYITRHPCDPGLQLQRLDAEDQRRPQLLHRGVHRAEGGGGAHWVPHIDVPPGQLNKSPSLQDVVTQWLLWLSEPLEWSSISNKQHSWDSARGSFSALPRAVLVFQCYRAPRTSEQLHCSSEKKSASANYFQSAIDYWALGGQFLHIFSYMCKFCATYMSSDF